MVLAVVVLGNCCFVAGIVVVGGFAYWVEFLGVGLAESIDQAGSTASDRLGSAMLELADWVAELSVVGSTMESMGSLAGWQEVEYSAKTVATESRIRITHSVLCLDESVDSTELVVADSLVVILAIVDH